MRRSMGLAGFLVATVVAPIAVGQGPAAPPRPARAATPTDPAVEAEARRELDRLLDEWEAKIKAITSLQVVFDRIDRSPKWGDQAYQGRALLKAPNLACLELRKAIPGPDGKPQYARDARGSDALVVEPESSERIVWTGSEVLLYEWDGKQVFVYPFAERSRRNVYTGALFDWSLPFLSNMTAAEARRRFELRLVKQDERSCTVAITPRPEPTRQNSFRNGYVILDRASFLPTKLVLLDVGDSERQDFFFRTIEPAEEFRDDDFRLATDLPGWKVVKLSERTTALPGAGWWARFLELNRPTPQEPAPAGAK